MGVTMHVPPFSGMPPKTSEFTSATPWLKLNPNYTKINVADQQNAANSILNFYRQMISIRKANPSLVYGNYAVINEAHKQVYAYWRWDDAVRYLILLNFSEDQQTFEVDDRFDTEALSLIIGNMGNCAKWRETRFSNYCRGRQPCTSFDPVVIKFWNC